MAERQNQGFFFEDYLSDMIKSFVKSTDYTDAIDGHMSIEALGNVACSAKNTEYGREICMGDMENIFESDEPTIMFAGFHYKCEQKPSSVSIYFYKNGFNPLFGNDNYNVWEFITLWESYITGKMDNHELVRELNLCLIDLGVVDYDTPKSELVPCITLQKFMSDEFNDDWKRVTELLKIHYELLGFNWYSPIHPRPKRSKSNKNNCRLQCAIPNRVLNDIASKHIVIQVEEIRDSSHYCVRDYLCCLDNYKNQYEQLLDDGELQIDYNISEDDIQYDPECNSKYYEYYFVDDPNGAYHDETAEKRAWKFVENLLYYFLED